MRFKPKSYWCGQNLNLALLISQLYVTDVYQYAESQSHECKSAQKLHLYGFIFSYIEESVIIVDMSQI